MRLNVTAVLALLLCASIPAEPQEQGPADPDRVERGDRQVTITQGIGNDMGWLGVQGEWYFGGGRLSAFSGVGWTPEFDEGDPSGPTFASGLRAYTPGPTHRGFAEVSLSQVAISTVRRLGPGGELSTDDDRHYGPGLQLGYQYTADSGFTAMASAGVGLAVDAPPGASDVQPLFGLGVGYTWR